MERASATRLHFKSSSSSSSSKHKSRRRSRSPSPPSSSSRRRYSRSRSRSPRRKKKKESSSSSIPSLRYQRRKDDRLSEHSRTFSPAGFAPDFDDDIDYEQELAKARAREAQEERDAQEAWTNHLFDELANDDPFEYHSSRFEDQSQPRYRSSSSTRATNNVHTMEDDQYAEYMRKGMGRSRTQKADQEWEEWVQEQERLKYLKEKESTRHKEEAKREKRRARKQVEEEERKAKAQQDDSPANRLRKRAIVERVREEYQYKWKLLLSTEEEKADVKDVMNTTLSWDAIPWPPLQSTLEANPSIASGSVSSAELSLFDFLFFGTSSDQQDVRKQLLRREQLKFHPDKFRQRFGTRLPKPEDGTEATGERDRILEMVDRVARALNEVSELL